ncbi:ABC transporter permease [Amycolatopsis magusensis]|uniref:ABC transporter permease n=1 Tax=Amycolatopsis magusensis TaxID=882444 RepID=UPI0024A8AB0A|nr:ABC transporter permease [Amycolatopsis magusensis]MDI5976695.1 ABC transporter permease [Amycolatopsis magusensis]
MSTASTIPASTSPGPADPEPADPRPAGRMSTEDRKSVPFTAAVETLALAGRRLVHLRKAPGRLLAVTLNSLITMLAIGYVFKDAVIVPGGGSYPEFLLPAALMQVGLASIAPTAIAVAMDLKGGLTDRFRSLPITRPSVLIGHTIGDLVVGLIALVLVVGAGVLVGGRVHTGFLPLLAGLGLLVVFLYVMIWVGVLLGLTMRNPESIDGIGAVMTLGLSFLSNAFMSIDRLPSWLRPIAEWNPVSSVTNAVRQLWGNPVAVGTDFPSRHPGVVIAVSLTVVFVLATLFSFRRYRVA